MAVCGNSLVKIPFLPALGLFMATVTDKRSSLDSPAAFFHEPVTVFVAGRTGATFFLTNNGPVTDIAQMTGTAESALVMGNKIIMLLEDSVFFYLLGNG